MRGAVALTAVALTVATPAAASAAAVCAGPADRAAARRAAAWLERQDASRMAPGQRADTVIALRAAGRRPAALRGRLAALRAVAPGYATTAGGSAKVVLATVAAGGDPTDLGGVDYLARVRRSYADGRFGSTAFDQALAILAYRAAGRRVPAGAVAALRATRGAGGWNFMLRASAPDSVDTTGLVLEALAAAGVSRRDRAVVGARAWIAAQQAPGGGYASSGRRRPAEANPTASAIRASCAFGVTPPARTRAALRRLQAADGSVRFTRRSAGSPLLATTDALPAFAGRAAPVR